MTKDRFLNRNFYGYGPKKPEFVWPEGKRVALSIVVNIEEGAELTLSSGDEKNEYVYENNFSNARKVLPVLVGPRIAERLSLE